MIFAVAVFLGFYHRAPVRPIRGVQKSQSEYCAFGKDFLAAISDTIEGSIFPAMPAEDPAVLWRSILCRRHDWGNIR
jgi:hypothetical protein